MEKVIMSRTKLEMIKIQFFLVGVVTTVIIMLIVVAVYLSV